MDSDKLVEELAALGMFELLEAYAGTLHDSQASQHLLARVKITQATAAGVSLPQRNQLLDEACTLLDHLIKAESTPSEPTELLEHFRLRLEWLETAGLVRSAPYATRWMYLQGSQADEKTQRKLIDDVANPMEDLKRQVEETYLDWRSNLKMLVTVVPDLEDLRDRLRYKSAWISFYRGMVLPDSQEKARILSEVLKDLRKLSQRDSALSIQHWLTLLAGMASRELNAHGQAEEYLNRVITYEAPDEAKIQALFELARNLIEAKRFPQASQATVTFRDQSASI